MYAACYSCLENFQTLQHHKYGKCQGPHLKDAAALLLGPFLKKKGLLDDGDVERATGKEANGSAEL